MTNDLSGGIQLNQSSLQDFLVCPRRFELKHLEQTSWPAAHSNPPSRIDELAELGNRFHLLCNQFFLGLDQDHISGSINDPVLKELWDRFYPYGRELKEHQHFSEQILRLSFHDHVLIAKFDYIGLLPDHNFLIVDWKTSSIKPDRTTLSNRVQTLLYPFMLFQTIDALFQVSDFYPENISLQYWYPRSSDPAETFPYSTKKHESNRSRLVDIITNLDELLERRASFPLTDDIDDCKYCLFRSFCERGTDTLNLDNNPDYESEDLSNTYFDMNIIEEIEF